MTCIGKYVALMSAVLIWLASPSWAELSVDQVWDDIVKRTKSLGYKVSTIQSRSDGILVLSELNLRHDNLDEGYSVNVNLGDMQLVLNNDGSVMVSPSKNIVWDFLLPNTARDTMTFKLIQKTKGLSIVASGAVGQITYDYSAEHIDAVFDEFAVQGDMMKSDEADLRISLIDVVGKSKVTGDALLETLSSFSARNINFMGRFAPKTEPYEGTWKTRLSNVSFASTGQVPDGVSLQDISLALSAGYNNSSVFGYEAGETDVSFNSGSEDLIFKSSSAGVTASNTMSISGLKSTSEIRSMKFAGSGDLLPLPVKAMLGSLEYGLDMPVMPRPEQQVFGLKLELNELSMSESVWKTFDPLNDLPHDPLSLKLDIEGAMLLLIDFLGSDMSKSDLNDFIKIAQIASLSFKSLLFSGFGAEVLAQGDFEFDNQDLKTFGGIPRPEGWAKVKLMGMNGFLEKVAKIGLIGSQQAMGAKMAMGMFALPIGDDMMQAKVEIDKNGGIFANGQKLR